MSRQNYESGITSDPLVIDYINGHDLFDGSLWYFDGQYVGHDDQIREYDFATNNTERLILFRHREFKPEVTFEDVEMLIGPEPLSDWEPFLREIET